MKLIMSIVIQIYNYGNEFNYVTIHYFYNKNPFLICILMYLCIYVYVLLKNDLLQVL